ncbi:MAG: DUF4190 domain-containing protein [Actinomycetota bacterium]|nr:DUF4190 domain-containing protein [Actinomycetota bacterium]
MAVVSLVAGIVWIFGVGAAVAVVAGIIALRQIRARGERGRGLAVAGIVLGGLGMAAAALLAVWAVARDQGPDEAGRTFDAKSLERVSWDASDLPPDYVLQPGLPRQATSVHQCVERATRERAALAAQLESLGMRGCFDAAYVKTVGTDSNRPGSTAYLFEDVGGASRALPALRNALAESYRGLGRGARSPEDVSVSDLGDESLPGVTFATPTGGGQRLTFTLYIWRIGNVVVYVAGTNSLGDMNEQTILDVARKIDSRAREGRNG